MSRPLSSLLALVLVAACVRREVPASSIPRFDVHAHLGPADLARAMEIFGRNRVVGAVNLSGGVGPMLEAQLAAAKPFEGRVLVFANLAPRHFLEPGWVEAQLALLRRAKAQGARGLKIYKALGLGFADPAGARVKVDDPRLDPIFEECARLGFPVALHVGDPKAFFRPPTPDNERYEELSLNPGWSFYGPAYPTWEELFQEFEARVQRHPATTFIGVHFGNDPEEPARAAALLDRHPNLVIDTAARLGEIGRAPPKRLRALFVAHRSRILFGTDFSALNGDLTLGAPMPGPPPTAADADRFFMLHWRFFETSERAIPHPTPIQGRWTIDAIGLPKDVLHDLYHRNAERLFGLPPLASAR